MNWDGTDLVKSAGLPVPFFDAVECRLAREVKHEKDGHSVVTDEWQHGNEFALSTEIPDLVIRDNCCARMVGQLLTEKVISVFLILMAFSIKLTPSVWM